LLPEGARNAMKIMPMAPNMHGAANPSTMIFTQPPPFLPRVGWSKGVLKKIKKFFFWTISTWRVYTSEIALASRTFPVPMLLAHTCTQVHWLSQPEPPASDWIRHETNVFTCIWQPT
jgi:hypothetical protein